VKNDVFEENRYGKCIIKAYQCYTKTNYIGPIYHHNQPLYPNYLTK